MLDQILVDRNLSFSLDQFFLQIWSADPIYIKSYSTGTFENWITSSKVFTSIKDLQSTSQLSIWSVDQKFFKVKKNFYPMSVPAAR